MLKKNILFCSLLFLSSMQTQSHEDPAEKTVLKIIRENVGQVIVTGGTVVILPLIYKNCITAFQTAFSNVRKTGLSKSLQFGINNIRKINKNSFSTSKEPTISAVTLVSLIALGGFLRSKKKSFEDVKSIIFKLSIPVAKEFVGHKVFDFFHDHNHDHTQNCPQHIKTGLEICMPCS